jgi:hypothetical protein
VVSNKENKMPDEKINLSQEQYLLAEVVMKVAAIERLLIKHQIINAEELFTEMKTVSEEVIAFVAKQSEDKTPPPVAKDKDTN